MSVPFFVKAAATAFFAIFPIVNPFSSAALLVTLTEGDSPSRIAEQVRRAVLFMTAILVASYFAGSFILNFFSIGRPALILAAGLLVSRSGWRTLTGADRLTPAQQEEGMHKQDVSFTPLGMPLLAGPGTISVVIGLASDPHGIAGAIAVMLAIALVGISSWLVLRAAPRVVGFLGKTGEAALSKVMGLIILCVGIQFLINGAGMVVREWMGAAGS